MIKLAGFKRGDSKLTSRRAAAALAALAFGVAGFAGPADAAPLPLFPFLPLPMLQPPMQPSPQPQIAPQNDDAVVTNELPARLKRQVVNYATREAPGTVVIDTGNTYLYLVLGGGRAMRYGIGVGRDGFTWRGVKSVTAKKEWPDWTPPAQMLQRRPDLPRHMPGGP